MPRRALLQTALGLAVSALFGWLALRGVDLAQMRHSLANARFAWLVPALAVLAVAIAMRAERWRSLFAHERAHPVSRSVALWTLGIGLFFNSALPARAGEVARVVALNRTAGVPRTQALTAVVVERVFDLASLALLLLVTATALPASGFVRTVLAACGAVVGVAVVATLLLLLARRRLRGPAERLVRRLPLLGGARAERTISSLGAGLHGLVDARRAVVVGAWSIGSWLALAVSNWCVLQAFSTRASWSAAVFTLVVTNLAMALPSTSGALGVFEAAGVSALGAYGVSKSTALPVALVLHGVNLLPFLPLGIVSMARLGLHAGDLRTSDDPVPEPAPPPASRDPV